MKLPIMLIMISSWSTFSLAFKEGIIPHITLPNSGFETLIHLENPLSISQNCYLTAVATDGGFLDTILREVSPGERFSFTVDQVFGEKPIGYLRINTDDGLTIGASYGRSGGVGSQAFLPMAERSSKHWRIYTGNWNEVFDGIAVVNQEFLPSTFRLVQRDSAGTVLATRDLNPLAPWSKTVLNLVDYFEPVPGAYIDIETELNVAVTGLRGSWTSARIGFLLGNTAIRLTSQPGELDKLLMNRKKWESAGISAYTFHYRNICFCIDDLVRSVRIVVQNGEIVLINYVDNDEVPTLNYLKGYRNVNELFAHIEDLIDQSPAELRVTYDETYGYPTEIYVDRERSTVDEEWIIQTGELVPVRSAN